jgi:hypothetical protein
MSTARVGTNVSRDQVRESGGSSRPARRRRANPNELELTAKLEKELPDRAAILCGARWR